MTKKELLNKSIKLSYGSKIPLFQGVYIIPRKELHDSGYKMLYVIGHTKYKESKKDYDYYLISNGSDVVDFQPSFENMLKDIFNVPDLHLDINKNGIIHIWTRGVKGLKRFKCTCPFLSSCTLEVEE